jgi:hypothetical protein
MLTWIPVADTCHPYPVMKAHVFGSPHTPKTTMLALEFNHGKAPIHK